MTVHHELEPDQAEEGRGAAAAERHWLEQLHSWPEVRFPLDVLRPHGHLFTTASDARAYNEAMCRDCGLRVLHLWLHSRDWVRRRTEAVTFLDDRTVRRQVTVDFVTPAYAPTLVVSGRELDLVPMALLQKKNLVHFDLRDHTGAALSLLGLRQQQTLTAAALKGVAESVAHRPAGSADLDRRLVDCLVFGDRPLVHCAMQSLVTDRAFAHLREDPLFLMASERFLDTWMMCLLLPREESVRRIIKFSYDEPLNLRFSAGHRGFCRQEDALLPPSYALQPADGGRRRVWAARVASGLGWGPVRIRFPIFSAESAQSYHLEVTAPPGALVRAAQALASRPEDPSGCQGAAPRRGRPRATDAQQCAAAARTGASAGHVVAPAPPTQRKWSDEEVRRRDADHRNPSRRDVPSFRDVPARDVPGHGVPGHDLPGQVPAPGRNVPGPVLDQVCGAYPTVDLHLTDVPRGSFSHAQVEMRAQMGGWLSSMTSRAG